jgi:hypothetical protein
MPPKGEVPVTAIIWTDKDTPGLVEDREQPIPPEAMVRIEGWTIYGEHTYRPIGGILAVVKANARAELKVSAQAAQGTQIRVMVHITPPAKDVPGAVEVTDLSGGPTRLVNYRTGPDGEASVVVETGRGRFEVEVFSSSTIEVAEAESEKMLVVV